MSVFFMTLVCKCCLRFTDAKCVHKRIFDRYDLLCDSQLYTMAIDAIPNSVLTVWVIELLGLQRFSDDS